MSEDSVFYTVLSEVGRSPRMYDIATSRELRCFVDGFRCSHAQNKLPQEVPPFGQFTEWLVRRLQRGNTTYCWSNIIKWGDMGEEQAIRDFGVLIDEFAMRIPTVFAKAEINKLRHRPLGTFQVGYIRPGETAVDLSATLPTRVQIKKYATDPGYYLEYEFVDDFHYESYKPDLDSVYASAAAHFGIEKTDWQVV